MKSQSDLKQYSRQTDNSKTIQFVECHMMKKLKEQPLKNIHPYPNGKIYIGSDLTDSTNNYVPCSLMDVALIMMPA